MNGKNTASKIFNFIGGIIIGLGIAGAIIIAESSKGDNTELIFLLSFFGSFVSGMLFIGFGEIIRLLQEINDNQANNDDIKTIIEILIKNSQDNDSEAKETAKSSFNKEPIKPRISFKTTAVPIWIGQQNNGKIICPVCSQEQDGKNYACSNCGQVFINGQPNIPYWCGICGQEGPFEDEKCPKCGACLKKYNTKA